MHAITVRHLRAALAVGRHYSFKRAAEELHVTQPALSLSVADLEQHLGLRLFDRTSRVVSATALGADFLREASSVMQDFDRLIASTIDVARSNRGRVVVSCPSSVAGRLMPSVVAASAERYPQIDVAVRDESVTDTLRSVEAGECDFGVTVRPRELSSRLVASDLLEDPYHVVLLRSDPLAGRDALSWDDLDGAVHVAFTPTSGSQDIVEREARRRGVSFSKVHSVSQLATATAMLEEGVGLSILPRLALPHPAHPMLAAMPLREPGLSRRIVFVQRKARSLSPAAERFRALLVERVGT